MGLRLLRRVEAAATGLRLSRWGGGCRHGVEIASEAEVSAGARAAPGCHGRELLARSPAASGQVNGAKVARPTAATRNSPRRLQPQRGDRRAAAGRVTDGRGSRPSHSIPWEETWLDTLRRGSRQSPPLENRGARAAGWPVSPGRVGKVAQLVRARHS